MKCCDLASGVGRLQRSAAQLKEQWRLAKEQWDDKASKRFQEDYLQSLPSQITLSVAAVYKLADALEQAERELEDSDVEY